MMGYWGYGWGPGMHVFGGIFSILVWIFFVAVIIALLRKGFRGRWDGWERDERKAIDILRERYARGEIGKEEYLEKKKDLETL